MTFGSCFGCWPKSLGYSMDQTAHAGLWEDLSRFLQRGRTKKHLLSWVQRLMRQNGLDAPDLQAVFERVARQQRMQLAEEKN